jgi:SNF2 family DNA or RNA helicase
MDEAVVVINFEGWRRDKEILAKLMEWEIDTIIIDEAHNLKSTTSAAFKNVKALVTCDNVCGRCSGHIRGLYDPEALKGNPSKKIPRPCPSCGWKIGERKRVEKSNPLEDLLVTRSVKRLCLTTGTPILNSPLDLFALLHLLDPVLFSTRTRFETAFLTSNHHSGKWEWRPGALQSLKPLIEGRFIARTREDAGIKLPPQNQHVIRVELNQAEYPLQYRTIQQISEAAHVQLDSGASMTIMHLIALITRKRQANVWPGGIEIRDLDKESPTFGEVIFSVGDEVRESVKMDALMENALRFHDEGHRQVVFSQFSTALDELETRLSDAGLRVAKLTGKTSPKMREQIKSNFYAAKGEEPRWDVLLCNYKAGGTGLNLTAATKTHILDEEWNPGKRDQAYGRNNRMGQTRETEVYIYRIPGTIDTWMSNLIRFKERIIEGFEDTMQGEQEESMMESLKKMLQDGEVL